jgi:NAD/NADP transhydrogenase alpha subunit
MPQQASDIYASNMFNLVEELCGGPGAKGSDAQSFRLDFTDKIVASATIIRDRQMFWKSYEDQLKEKEAAELKRKEAAAKETSPGKGDKQPEKSPLPGPMASTKTPTEEKKDLAPAPTSPLKEAFIEKTKQPNENEEEETSQIAETHACSSSFLILAMTGLAIALAYSTNYSFMLNFLSFILALIIGYIVVWGVDPRLHASLMSETNAISGIIAIGAMLQLYGYNGSYCLPNICGLIALFFAFINVFGGFRLTDKMLSLLRLG